MHGHPKRNKYCAYCNYWLGDAKLKFVSNGMGFEFDQRAKGKCIKANGSPRDAGSGCTANYEPSPDAKKLL